MSERGFVSRVEALVLAVMATIVIAIAIPSYVAMRDRSHDAAARARVQQAVDAIEAYHADRGTYAGLSSSRLARYDSELGSSYRLKGATKDRYCVETSVGGRTWHQAGPAGDVARGGCS